MNYCYGLLSIWILFRGVQHWIIMTQSVSDRIHIGFPVFLFVTHNLSFTMSRLKDINACLSLEHCLFRSFVNKEVYKNILKLNY